MDHQFKTGTLVELTAPIKGHRMIVREGTRGMIVSHGKFAYLRVVDQFGLPIQLSIEVFEPEFDVIGVAGLDQPLWSVFDPRGLREWSETA